HLVQDRAEWLPTCLAHGRTPPFALWFVTCLQQTYRPTGIRFVSPVHTLQRSCQRRTRPVLRWNSFLSRSFAWPWIYCPVWAAFAGGETGPQLWPKQHSLQANLAVYRHGMQIAPRKGGEPSG